MTIQSAMLVLLGFLSATFVVFVLAPLYRRRIARMATDALRRSAPLTATEIAADKDRLRAEYAVRLHKQALKLKDFESAGARQLIELNRRDARIGELQSEIDRLTVELEETTNARSVLEQTIEERLPKVEQRLVEAKRLIFNRDRDIAALTGESERTIRALDEAMQINAQQRAELARLQGSATARGASSFGALADPRFDAEVALRSEVEALRAQNRDQASLITRLQAAVSGVPADSDTSNIALLEAERLKRETREPLALPPPAADGLKNELDAARAKLDEQDGEIKRLKAALAAYEQPGPDSKTLSVRDSKIALKAKVSSLQSQVDTQGENIKRLRTELAAANEKLARQATYFMDEMRRLGAGSLPASAPSSSRRTTDAGAPRNLRDRIAKVAPQVAERMAPLTDAGLSDETKPTSTAADGGNGHDKSPTPVSDAANGSNKVADQIKALSGETDAAPAADGPAASPPSEERRRGRLAERIADAGKS